jgi:C4-dicarboxylate-specific signal transduction histidine kinase
MPAGPDAEILRLRRALRDLVALSAIPATWVGREPQAIAAGLADVLVGSLHLDFAFVRLRDPQVGATVEVAQGIAWDAPPEWLQNHLSIASRFSHREIIPDPGNSAESCRAIIIPIGVNAEGGLVAAACDRADFPDEIDQLLLSVAANQAATAFHGASLTHELRKTRDELEIKVAERTADLRRSETYLAEAQRLSHMGSFGWKVSTGELYWSEETFRIFECDRADKPTVELVLRRTHPEDRAIVEHAVDRAQREREGFSFDHRLLMPDGSVKYLRVVAHASRDDEPGKLEFVGAVTDITERKRAEEALRQSAEALAQAHVDLAHISRVTTMGELTASLAHELYQPIAAAVTNAKTCLRWLTRDPPNLEEVRDAASRIVGDATRAADIISRIRLPFKKGAPQREWIDVNDVIREMIVLLRTEANRYSISIRADLSRDLPSVMADRVQLQQVFMNLMLNGMDAMKDMSPAGELTIRSRAEDGRLLISVSDTGAGLPPQVDEIFSAFFTTKPDGIGMGLTISRSIIESHGGRLWATANSGRGATFHFTLPGNAEAS